MLRQSTNTAVSRVIYGLVTRCIAKVMSEQSCAPSPSISELLRLCAVDERGGMTHLMAEPPDDAIAPPPPPGTSNRLADQPKSLMTVNIKPTERTAKIVSGNTCPEQGYARIQPREEPRSRGWNSSTQVARTFAKPLKHQILCRNFVPPPPPAAVDHKAAGELLVRLSKATISSRMKGCGAPSNSVEADVSVPNTFDMDRKRLHLHQRQMAAKQRLTETDGGGGVSDYLLAGRESIELLLFYRREVDKRLRNDPMYALHQDLQL